MCIRDSGLGCADLGSGGIGAGLSTLGGWVTGEVAFRVAMGGRSGGRSDGLPVGEVLVRVAMGGFAGRCVGKLSVSLRGGLDSLGARLGLTWLAVVVVPAPV